MRQRFEFSFAQIAGGKDPSDDATLALLGSQGWEIRGVAAMPSGVLTIALQRPVDEEHPLPEREVLAATLEPPLHVPNADEFDVVSRTTDS